MTQGAVPFALGEQQGLQMIAAGARLTDVLNNLCDTTSTLTHRT
jgi:hypothetical protein